MAKKKRITILLTFLSNILILMLLLYRLWASSTVREKHVTGTKPVYEDCYYLSPTPWFSFGCIRKTKLSLQTDLLCNQSSESIIKAIPYHG